MQEPSDFYIYLYRNHDGGNYSYGVPLAYCFSSDFLRTGPDHRGAYDAVFRNLADTVWTKPN